MTYGQRQEEQRLFTAKLPSDDRAKHMFATTFSHGANKKKLAQLLTVWDFTMSLLKWNDVTLTDIVTGYQASIDAKYHTDYKAVATIEELDKRMAMRRSSAYRQENQMQGGQQ